MYQQMKEVSANMRAFKGEKKEGRPFTRKKREEEEEEEEDDDDDRSCRRRGVVEGEMWETH